jgi:dihydroorotate dehydrogenase electron transfer subunit
MSQVQASSKKGVFDALVVANRQIGKCYHSMTLQFTGEGAVAFASFRAGQFFQLDVSQAATPSTQGQAQYVQDNARRSVLLRRPFSFADVTVRGDIVQAELLYCVVGPGSFRMTGFHKGDSVSIVGPLGNGFWVPEGKRVALLVVGGMGAPPIRCLAKSLTAEHSEIEAVALVGAKTADALPFEGRLDQVSQQLGFTIPAFAQFAIPSTIATDDGSLGYRGMVTECLTQWLMENSDRPRNEIVTYACGPEQMLAAVAKIAIDQKIDCQVSMERRMACGTGLCQSCAVECRIAGLNEAVYKLCCKDGPVFDAREVVFNTDAI